MSVVSDLADIDTRPLVSVVTGTFNEEDNIGEFVRRVAAVFAALPEYRMEIICIDNASTDGTAAKLRELAAAEPRLRVILNARNFGHIRSPYHAMLQARGSAVVTLASDLQDPPELIPEFLKRWKEGAKVVAAVKRRTTESWLLSAARRIFYALNQRLADIQTIPHFTGFGLYDQRVIELCRSLGDPYPYFRGLVAEFGLPTSLVPFDKPRRKRGLTKNNFYILYDIAMLGLTNHSKVPLRLATMLGFAMSMLSLLVAAAYFLYKLIYWYEFSAGIAPVVIGLFLFSSVQLFFIGVLGEYIGALHTQVLRRPHVIERERINFPPLPDAPPAVSREGPAGPSAAPQ